MPIAKAHRPLPDVPGPERQNRYFLLYELFHSISSTLDPHKALNLIIDAAVELTGATNGSLILVDWEKRVLNIEVARGFAERVEKMKLKVGEGITGWVAATGQPVLLRDVSQDPRYVQLNANIKSELAVPLTIDERLIGVLNVDSTRLNAFDEDDLDLLILLSKQSARVIQNGWLFDTVTRQVEELSTLIEINKTIAGTLSLDKILPTVVERTARLTRAKICSVLLLSDDKEELILRAQHGGSAGYAQRPNIRVAGSILHKALQGRKPLEIPDVSRDRSDAFGKVAGAEGVRSMLAVPLVARGQAIGLLNIYKARRYHFNKDEKRLLKTLADLCAVAIENARLYSRMVTLEEQSRRAERLTSVGELAVGIAHEIRNPLTIVKMIFESGGELNRRDREVISEELARMNKIIAHMLDYTRPREPARESCDVNRRLENALLLLGHEMENKHIVVTTDLQPQLPRIQADPVQLQQVFLNLLLNACEALPEGGKVTVGSRLRGKNRVEIAIQDNGAGLPRQVRENLFVPFTTTKSRGLGLGLSIVKRIVDSHQGSLELRRAAGGGTLARIRLPVGE